MEVPFTWKPTGWFQIGWSAEFATGEVRPLRFFGEDLVAYRDDHGELHVLQGHCPHLGAHIGHGGTVAGDCVECPYHGWVWGPDGENKRIPYQDRPNTSHRLRVWPLSEQYGCVFMWHQPQRRGADVAHAGRVPVLPAVRDRPGCVLPPVSHLRGPRRARAVHPQVVAENGPDSVHFQRVHRATVSPVALDWKVVDHEWQFLTGWPDARSDDPDAMSLRIHSHLFGLGGAISAFEGAQSHRLVFAVTPVEDGCSDMFYTVWWPRLPGDDSMIPPDELRERVEKEFMITMWDDLEIWRYQKYVEHPALARQDAKPYKALRQWARQFYEIPPGG